MNRPADVATIVRAAEAAAVVLLRAEGERASLAISEKAPADYVSQADLDAERAIRKVLGHERPDAAILGEEEKPGPSRGERARFVVDPLDGSTNFLHGIPHYAVSIALEVDGELEAGVVLDVPKRELYWAARGVGAFLNDRPIRVAKAPALAHAVITTGIPHRDRGDHAVYLPRLARVMASVAGVRRFGAAALDLAFVAAGRCDGFFETDLSRWDVAAGTLLVREAGGVVTEIEGGPNVLDTGRVLAATPELHAPLLKLMRG